MFAQTVRLINVLIVQRVDLMPATYVIWALHTTIIRISAIVTLAIILIYKSIIVFLAPN